MRTVYAASDALDRHPVEATITALSRAGAAHRLQRACLESLRRRDRRTLMRVAELEVRLGDVVATTSDRKNRDMARRLLYWMWDEYERQG